ncbi:MAG: LamG-like jellyroll fold domain-containing protein [Rhodopirellula bahusiensis]
MDVLIEDELKTRLLDSLDQLRSFGEDVSSNAVLETNIPVLEQTLNQIFAASSGADDIDSVGDFLDFHAATQAYFDSTDQPTVLGLVDVLNETLQSRLGFTTQGGLTRGPFSISGGLDSANDRIEFEIVIDAAADLELPFDLEATSGGLGLSVNIAPTTQATIDADFGFGVDYSDLVDGNPDTSFDDEDAFVRFDGLNASASLQDSGFTTAFQLGMLEGGVAASGPFEGETKNSEVKLEASLNIELPSDTDANSDGVVSLQEFRNRSGFQIDVSGPADGSNMLDVFLPLSASLGGFDLGVVDPAIRVTDLDLFDDLNPEVTATGLDGFSDLSSLRPGDIVLMLIRLGDELQRVASELNPESGIPFVDTAIEEVVDLSGTLTNLARKLYRIPEVGSDLPATRLDGVLTQDATFHVQVDGGELVTLNLPVDQTRNNRSLDDLAADWNAVVAGTSLAGRVIAKRDGERLTLAGANEGAVLSIALSTVSLTSTDPVSSGGQLIDDLTLELDINGEPHTQAVTLPASLTEDNRDAADLADDLNLALADAGLAGQLEFIVEATGLVIRSKSDGIESLVLRGGEAIGFETNQSHDDNAAIDALGFGGGSRVSAAFKFNTLEEFADELSRALSDSVSGTPFEVGLDYDEDARTVSFNLGLNANFEKAISLDFGSGLDLGIGNLEVIAGTDARFIADASIQLGVGIDLSAIGSNASLSRETRLTDFLDGGTEATAFNVGLVAESGIPVEGMPGSDAAFTIITTDQDGVATTHALTLPLTETNDNFDAFDLAADLNALFAAEGLAAIEAGVLSDATGDRLTLRAIDGSVIAIEIEAADPLGFAAAGQSSVTDTNFEDLTILLRDTTAFGVNLDGAVTLGDVIDRINAAATDVSTDVEATFDVDRLVLTDRSSGQADFRVRAVSDIQSIVSPAAQLLGIAAVGEDNDVISVIEGRALHGDSILNHFFVDTSFQGDSGSNIVLSARIEADDIDLQAALGILDIGIVDGTAEIDLGTSVGFVDPDGRLTLDELRTRDFSEIIQRDALTLTGSAELPIRSSVLDAIGGNLDRPQIDVALFADEANPVPEITFTRNEAFDELLSGFSEFSVESVVLALQAFVGVLQNSDLEILSEQIPLIDVSLGDTLAVADDLLAVARDLATGPDLNLLATLQEDLDSTIDRLAVIDAEKELLRTASRRLASVVATRPVELVSTLVGVVGTLRSEVASIPSGTPGLSEVQDTVDAVDSLIASVSSMGDLIEDALVQQLGITDPNLLNLTVDFVDGNSLLEGSQTILVLGIEIQKEVQQSLDLSVELPDIGPLSIESGSQVDFGVGGSIAIALGIDVSNAFGGLSSPLLLIQPGAIAGVPHTSIDLNAEINAPIQLDVGIGGLSASLTGEAVLGASIRQILPGSGPFSNVTLNRIPIASELVIVTVDGNVLDTDAYTVNGRSLVLVNPVSGDVVVEYPSESAQGPAFVSLGFDETLIPTDQPARGFNTIGGVPISTVLRQGFSGVDANVQGMIYTTLELDAPGLSTSGSISIASDLSNFDPVIHADAASSLFHGPPDLSQLSLNQIVDGLSSFVNGLESGLTSDVLTSLPIIGEGFDLTGSFVGRIRESVITPIEQALVTTSTASEQFRVDLQQTLVDALGVQPGDVIVTLSDPAATAFADMEFAIEVSLSGRDEIVAPFDLGLDALAFEVESNGGVILGMDYDFTLGFGVNATDGFFVSLNDDSATPELNFGVDVSLTPGTELTTRLFALEFTAADNGTTGLSGDLFFDLIDPDNRDGKNRLTFAELSGPGGFSSLFDAGISTQARVDMNLMADINPSVPSISADLIVDWPISFTKNAGFVGDLPVVTLADVSLDVGSFFETVLGPVVSEVNDKIEPVRDVVDLITQEIPGISDLSILAGNGPVDFLTLASFQFPKEAKIARQAAGVVKQIGEVIDLVDEASQTGGKINFGSVTLGAGDGVDLTSPTQGFSIDPSQITGGVSSVADAISRSGGDRRAKSTLNRFARTPNSQGEGGMGVKFPLFEDPSNIFKLITGETVDLIQWDIPKVELSFSYDQTFFPIPGIPLGVTVGAGVDFFADFQIGFDTRGLFGGEAPSLDAFKTLAPASFLDGLHFIDLRDGVDIDELGFGIEASVGAALDLSGIAIAGIEGGIRADVYANWFDPNEDGKIYLDELTKIVDRIGVSCVFDIRGEVSAFLRAYYEFLIFSGEVDIVDITLFEFSNTCPPPPEPAVLGAEGVLRLNMGPFADDFQNGFSEDIGEVFTVRQISGDGSTGVIEVTGINGTTATQRYSGVTRIIADGGQGNDEITIEASVKLPTVIRGGAGDDRITGGSGTTRIEGGEGDDTLIAGSGPTTILGGIGDDLITGGGADDRLFGEDGDDTITGGGGDDQLFGGSGDDQIAGLDGNDLIDGGTGNDTLDGGDGDDQYVFASGFGVDSISENPNLGFDTLSFSDVTESLEFSLASRTVTTVSGSDRLDFFGVSIESLIGGQSTDTILGEAIATNWDILKTGQGERVNASGTLLFDSIESIVAGADVDQFNMHATGSLLGLLDAGGGFNTLDYSRKRTGIQFDLDDGTASATDSVANIQRVIGSPEDDNIRAGDLFAIEVIAGAGDDILFGSPLADVLNGGIGDDIIEGFAGDDILVGELGVDTLYGGDGDDLLDGGLGDDKLFGDAGRDQLIGGDGEDTIRGGLDDDWIIGGLGNDKLFGDEGQDVLWGGVAFLQQAQLNFGISSNFTLPPRFEELGLDENDTPVPLITPVAINGMSLPGSLDGEDTLEGGEGMDWLFGGGQDDVLRGGDDSDYLDGGLGNDSIQGDAGHDIARGGFGFDLIDGGVGIDLVYGDQGDDRLFGDAGLAGSQVGQRLFGGDGNDQLFAYSESAPLESIGDELRGDAGNDQLFGNLRRELLIGGSGNDFLHGDYLAGPDYQVNTAADSSGDADELFGGSGEDQLFGGGGDDLMFGGADSDQLDGQLGSDTQYGGSGIDLFFLPRDEQAYSPADRDTIDGHFGNETFGDVADDNATDIVALAGTSNDDVIVISQESVGGEANPLLHIAHTFRTGPSDSDFENRDLRVRILSDVGELLVEQIQVAGLAGDDHIGFAAASLPAGFDSKFDAFDLSKQNDGRAPLDLTALAARSRDFVGVFDGNSDNDVLFGGAGRDRLDGGIGSDNLFGFGGDDRLWGDLGDGNSQDHDVLFAGQGNDDLVGGQGTNELYSWSFDPTSDGAFGVFVDADGNLVGGNPDEILNQESTGLNRILGGPNDDDLFGGTGVDFLYGNGGNDTLFRSDGSTFESLDEGLAGDEWKEYARDTGQVWYVGGSNADDEIAVDFVTEPGLLTDHHLITRLTDNNGNFSFAAQVRLDFAALDGDGNRIWDASDIVTNANALAVVNERLRVEGSEPADDQARAELLSQVQQNETQLVSSLLPPEGDFLAIIVDALGGNDRVTVGPTVQKSVWVDGGSGDDTITIRSGNAILVDQAERAVGENELIARNDSPEFAFDLFDESSVIRDLQFTGLSMDSPADQDWFAFSVPAGTTGTLELASGSPIDGLGLAIYSQAGQNLVTSSDQGSVSVNSLSGNTTYWLAVTNPNQVPTLYDLRFDFGLGDLQTTSLAIRNDAVRRDVILGGDGNDVLLGGGGEDWIFGGAGNDVLSGGLDRGASDLLFAGPGDDTFQIIPDALPLLGNQPNTQFDPATETFLPTFSDQFIGGDGEDRVLFLGGDLDRRGFEVPDFAAIRYNTVLHRYEFASLLWDIGQQQFVEDSTGNLVQQYLFYQTRDVETTQIDLRSGNDVFHADEFSFAGSPETFGIDLGDFQQGATESNLLIDGGPGDDELFGGVGDDNINGSGGDDLIVGGLGNDTVDAGAGDDRLFGGVVSSNTVSASLPAEIADVTATINSQVPANADSETYRFELAAPFQADSVDTRPGILLDDITSLDDDSTDTINEQSALLVGHEPDSFVKEVRLVGDVNDDNQDDFLIVTDTESLLVFGPFDIEGQVTTRDLGDVIIDHTEMGKPATGFGDVTGDGVDDLVLVRYAQGFTTIRVFPGGASVWDERILVTRPDTLQIQLNDAQINGSGVAVSVIQSDGDVHADLLITSTTTDGTSVSDLPAGLSEDRAFNAEFNAVIDGTLYLQSDGKILRTNQHGDFEIYLDNADTSSKTLVGASGPWLIFDRTSAFNVETETRIEGSFGVSGTSNPIALGDAILYNGSSGRPYRWDTGSETAVQLSTEGVMKESILFGDEAIIAFDTDAHGTVLFRWDGVGEPTPLEGLSGAGPINPRDFAILDGQLYFTAENRTGASQGSELWRYDGTTTELAGPVRPGPEGVNPQQTIAFDGSLYFRGNLGVEGSELYQFTPGSGIELIADLNPLDGQSSSPRDFTVAGGYLYFNAAIPVDTSGQTGQRLMRFDGSNVVLASSRSIGFSGALVGVDDFIFHSFAFDDLGLSEGQAGRISLNHTAGFILPGNRVADFQLDAFQRADGTIDDTTLTRITFTEPFANPADQSLIEAVGDVNGDGLTDFTVQVDQTLPAVIQNATFSGTIDFPIEERVLVEFESSGQTEAFNLEASNLDEFRSAAQTAIGLSPIAGEIELRQQAGDLVFANSFAGDSFDAAGRFEVRQADTATAPILNNPHSLHFDGSDVLEAEPIAEINVGSSEIFTTVEAWVRAEFDDGSPRTIFATGSSANSANLARGFELQAGGNWQVKIAKSGNDFEVVQGPEVIPGRWTHIAVTIFWGSGPTAPSVKLYVDGEEVQSFAYPSNVNTFRPNNAATSIGGGSITGAAPWSGGIDEVRVWSRGGTAHSGNAVARSAEQIRENYLKSVAHDDTGLVAYWKFDDGNGNGADDSAGNHHAAILGADWNTRQFRVVGGTDAEVQRSFLYGNHFDGGRVTVDVGNSAGDIQDIVPLGDVNGDGRDDVGIIGDFGVGVHFGSQSAVDLLADANLQSQSDTVDSIASGDFNGDYQMDLALGDSTTSQLMLYYSVGSLPSSLDPAQADRTHRIGDLPPASLILTSGVSLDGDHRDDLIVQTTPIDPVNGNVQQQSLILQGSNRGGVVDSELILENRSVPGSGSFVVDRGTGRPEVFGDGSDPFVFPELSLQQFFRFTTLGDGSEGDFIGLITDDSSLRLQLFDSLLAPISPRVGSADLRGLDAGTYFVRVDGAVPASFRLEMQAPIAGQVSSDSTLRDRDILRGGEGSDFIAGNTQIDRIYGGSGSDQIEAESIEVRDFNSLVDVFASVPIEQRIGQNIPGEIDPVVEIADAGIRSAIAEQLGIAITIGFDGNPRLAEVLRESRLSSIASLDASGRSVTDISDLTKLINLVSLDLSDNPAIGNFDALLSIPRLKHLDLEGTFGPAGRLSSFDWQSLQHLDSLRMSSLLATLPSNLVIDEGAGITFTMTGASFQIVDETGTILEECNACTTFAFTPMNDGVFYLEQKRADPMAFVDPPVAPIIVRNVAPSVVDLPTEIRIDEGDTRSVDELLTGVTFMDPGDDLTRQVTITDSAGRVTDLTTGSLEFSDDLVELDATIVDGAADLTTAFWLKTSKTGQQAIVSAARSDSSNNEYLLFFQNDTELRFFSGSNRSFTGLPSIADDEWHHFVVVADSSADQVELYLDGAFHSSISIDLDGFDVAAGGLFLGQDQDRVGGDFDENQAIEGSLDEFAMWRRALNSEQARQVFKSGVESISADLAVYLPLDDASGNIASDASGLGRDGRVAERTGEFQSGSSAKPGWNADSALSESLFDAIDEGRFTLEVTAHDGDGGVTTARSTIVVSNLAPTAMFDASADFSAASQPVFFDASGSTDPGPLDEASLSYRWEITSPGLFSPIVLDTQAIEFTPEFAGLYNVTLTVTDSGMLSDQTTQTLEVVPQANLDVLSGEIDSLVFQEGGEVTLHSRGSSPLAPFGNSSRRYEWRVFEFDGATLLPDGNSPSTTFTAGSRGLLTVGLSVVDTVAGVEYTSASVTQYLTIENVAPTVDLGNDIITTEGTSFTIDPSIFDPGQDEDFFLDWVIPDGIVQQSFEAPFEFLALDNGVYEIGLLVSDGSVFLNNFGDFLTSELATVTVQVNNLAPVVTDITVSDNLIESDNGNVVDLTALFDDPANVAGGDDAIERDNGERSFDFVWTFGDGSDPLVTTSPNVSHRFPDSGNYEVRVTVTDKDGDTGEITRTLVIENAAPSELSLTAPANVLEDDPVIFSGSFKDLDGKIDDLDLEPVTATIDFGDGTTEVVSLSSVVENAVRSYSFVADHLYRRGGTYSVTLTTRDDDGGESTLTTSLSVTELNDAPSAKTDRFSVPSGTVDFAIDVLANDSSAPDPVETLTITSVTPSVHGGTTSIDVASGRVLYTPRPGFVGADRFTYTISDGNGGTADGSVVLNVTPANSSLLRLDTSSRDNSDYQVRLSGSLIEIRDADSGELIETRNILALQRIEIVGRDDLDQTFDLVFNSSVGLDLPGGIEIVAGGSSNDQLLISGTADLTIAIETPDSTSDTRRITLGDGDSILSIDTTGIENLVTSFPPRRLSNDELQVGTDTLSLTQPMILGSFVTLTIGDATGDGRVEFGGGLEIDFGSSVSGHGTLSGNIINQGVIIGPPVDSGQQLVINGEVSGAGSFVGHVVVTGVFRPGNSPAEVAIDGNLTFLPTSRLEVEVEDDGLPANDLLTISGEFVASGTLDIRNHTAAGSLQRFERRTIITADSIQGQFDTILGSENTFANGRLYLDVYQSPSGIELVVMPTTYHNTENAYDVNLDGNVTALDALLIINELNRSGSGASSRPRATEESQIHLFDPSDDGMITALDALQVINELNRASSDATGEALLSQEAWQLRPEAETLSTSPYDLDFYHLTHERLRVVSPPLIPSVRIDQAIELLAQDPKREEPAPDDQSEQTSQLDLLQRPTNAESIEDH